ncbi:hypothetical protein GCM10027403_09930 [Arthrobacter tecti]
MPTPLFWQRWADQEERWLRADNPSAGADILVHGHTADSLPQRVRLALTGLPQCESLMSMERAARRGLTLQVETVDAYPDGAELFAGIYGASNAAAWLDSSTLEDPLDRSRFSVLADDGGRFGQVAVRSCEHLAEAFSQAGHGGCMRQAH